jgi:hypothetical protein
MNSYFEILYMTDKEKTPNFLGKAVKTCCKSEYQI